MKKLFYTFVAVAGVFIGFASFTSAVSIFDITYPIAELNGCASQAECKVYCDDSDHKNACLNFAEKYGLVSKEKVEEAKKLPKIGPGGCQGEKECRAYCDNIDHENECLAFASKYGMKINDPRGAAVSARARLIKERGGPGNCQSQKECLAYCDNPARQGECIAFAEANGLMSKEEIEKAKQMINKSGPGGCVGRECHDFCNKPENQEVCFQFAADNKLIPEKEINRVIKMRQAMQNGPGGCVNEKECRAYCDNTDHFKECGEFAKKNDLMDEKEIKIMERNAELNQKVKQIGGPGGCKSGDECLAYCGNPDHVEECLSFAVEHSDMDKDEARKSLDDFTKIRSHKINSQPRPSIVEGDELTVSPGGCKTEEECVKYCSDPAHRAECGNSDLQTQPPGEIFRQMEPGGEKEFRKYNNMPIGILQKCISEGGTVEKSAGSDIPKCVRIGGGEIIIESDDLIEDGDGGGDLRGGFAGENKQEDSRKCGPKPLRPTPQGCDGPICKDGRWDFVCQNFNDKEIPQPQPGRILGDGKREGILCTQEYKPVCGANNRTYPNECFAKADSVVIAKEGPCQAVNEEKPLIQPMDGYQNFVQPPVDQYNFQPREIRPLIQPDQQRLMPQSRRTNDSFLSNALNLFSRALKFK